MKFTHHHYQLLPDTPSVIQASFTRHYGVSCPPYDSLNCSFGVGDKEEDVRKNRELIKKTLGLSCLLSARQVHGDRVEHITQPPEDDLEMEGVDAFTTNTAGIGLMIQHADCQAILLYDRDQSALAAIHCGWRGSVLNIIEKTVEKMTVLFQTRPQDILAGISPSLGPCCAEFIHYKKELPSSFHAFQTRTNHFDFWKISQNQLINAGLKAENISMARVCTSCNDDYFSYRRAKKQSMPTGRNCSIIGLTQNPIVSPRCM